MKYTKLNPSKSTGLKISKKKRKFRVMTVEEWCDKANCKKCEYCSDSVFCDYLQFNGITMMKISNTPYKTKNNKYILIEVKNNGRK